MPPTPSTSFKGVGAVVLHDSIIHQHLNRLVEECGGREFAAVVAGVHGRQMDKIAGLPITADCTGIGGIAWHWPESAPSSGIDRYQVQSTHVSTVVGFGMVMIPSVGVW